MDGHPLRPGPRPQDRRRRLPTGEDALWWAEAPRKNSRTAQRRVLCWTPEDAPRLWAPCLTAGRTHRALHPSAHPPGWGSRDTAPGFKASQPGARWAPGVVSSQARAWLPCSMPPSQSRPRPSPVWRHCQPLGRGSPDGGVRLSAALTVGAGGAALALCQGRAGAGRGRAGDLVAHGFELLQGKKDTRVTLGRRECGARARGADGGRSPTWQEHLVQLSTTQVSFSAKNRPSCQQADTFLVFGGPPMSSQRNWLSLDWKTRGRCKSG